MTSSRYSLLKTILSRCQVISLSKANDKISLNEMLYKKFLNKEEYNDELKEKIDSYILNTIRFVNNYEKNTREILNRDIKRDKNLMKEIIDNDKGGMKLDMEKRTNKDTFDNFQNLNWYHMHNRIQY